ncbi:hypothetical protein P879_00113 [Paragonimus westermani]|uniref:Uncharacterized protein n=1 Tax=Paragonimus westermani TaxID=34504 RepID=A0A8T0DWN0_9TREM|nr:hypothetical protein P879_00113 [Paragonimus westermani]
MSSYIIFISFRQEYEVKEINQSPVSSVSVFRERQKRMLRKQHTIADLSSRMQSAMVPQDFGRCYGILTVLRFLSLPNKMILVTRPEKKSKGISQTGELFLKANYQMKNCYYVYLCRMSIAMHILLNWSLIP